MKKSRSIGIFLLLLLFCVSSNLYPQEPIDKLRENLYQLLTIQQRRLNLSQELSTVSKNINSFTQTLLMESDLLRELANESLKVVTDMTKDLEKLQTWSEGLKTDLADSKLLMQEVKTSLTTALDLWKISRAKMIKRLITIGVISAVIGAGAVYLVLR